MFNCVSIALVVGWLCGLHVEATVNTVPGHNRALCDGNKDSNGFRPHPVDCSSFYYCEGSLPVVIECPNGNEWDINNQRCACPRIAQCSCDDDHQPTPPTQPPPTTTTPDGGVCDEGQSYPCPWDCNKYYYCKHGELVIKNCPGHTHFDLYKSKCVGIPWAHCYQNTTSVPVTVTWPPPPPPSSTTDDSYNPCNGAEFYPCPWDCSKFFHCDGTIAYLKDCPSGTQWDIKSDRCEWPIIAQCEVTLSTADTHEVTDKPDSSTADGGKSSEELDNPCKGEEFYSYPGDCSKYYYCDGNTPSVRNCPSGTDWDTKSNRCQWPDIANCKLVNSPV